jgi:hydrogenase large subunit
MVLALVNGPLWPLATSAAGVGFQNYLSYGGFPLNDTDFLFPAGAMVGGQLLTTSRSAIEQAISEDVTRSWYTSTGAGHPYSSAQDFALNKPHTYTFIKAPRYQGYPMEVGPLARMLVLLEQPDHPGMQHPSALAFAGMIKNGLKPGAVARHLARALETRMLVTGLQRELNELNALIDTSAQVPIHDTAHWEPPVLGQGWGMTEAPRGALGHWIKIENGKIAHYACVVPTTWNGSPEDGAAVAGPIEQALIGCPVPDESNPVNVTRIIRSFDPCIACAVHVLAPAGSMKQYVIRA